MARNRNTRRIRERVAKTRYKINLTDRDALVPCYWCFISAPWPGMTNEHLVPVANGGTNGPSNIVFAHDACNQARDQHSKACETCGHGGPCLKAMIYRQCSIRGGRPSCPLGNGRWKSLRQSLLRYFSIVSMVRSGRDFLRLDTLGDPHIRVPLTLANRSR